MRVLLERIDPPFRYSSFSQRPEVWRVSCSGPTVLGISHASGCLNYSREHLGILRFPNPLYHHQQIFFLSKGPGESVCKYFKGDKVYSQQMMPWLNSKGPGKRQNHGLEGELLMSWNLRGMWWNLLMWTRQKIKVFNLPLAGVRWAARAPEKVKKKMFFVIEKLFDKLPDIMGLILPSLRSEKLKL